MTDHLLAGGDPLYAIGQHPAHPFNWPKSVLDHVAPGKSFQPISGYPQIIKEMTAAGDGARGIIHGMRVDPVTGLPESGHVFNVVNRGGRIYFLDGQIGGWAYLEKYHAFEFLRTN